jgi:large subunit ribosomal protein L6
MSRIGKKPVVLPQGITATVADAAVTVKGPKGELTLAVHPHAHVVLRDEEGVSALHVSVDDPEKDDRAIWGTMRALLAQMVSGVSEGFQKSLELNGVGFKMNLNGNKLTFSVGFSHDITYELPAGVSAKIEGSVLTLAGADAQAVGRVAAEIRAFKKPEPYKGKGFRYTDEIVRRKAGKAAKGDK